MVTEIKINTSHSQIAVFDPCIDNPFNAWKQAHVNQGFSWRNHSVSFKTLIETGAHTVRIERGEIDEEIYESSKRTIRVPFEVKTGFVEIGGVLGSETVAMPPGLYMLEALFFEPINEANASTLLRFVATDDRTEFLVVKADDALDVPQELEIEAQAAI